MDYYNVVTEPSETPVSLIDVKPYLRIRSGITKDDALITALIESAVNFGEKFCNRCFVQRDIEGFFATLCLSKFEKAPFIEVRRAPLISITSVEIDSGSGYTAFTSYTLKQSNGFSRILFNDTSDVVLNDGEIPYPIKVTFKAGYGAAGDVPDAIQTALKAHVSFLYENRGDAVAEGKLSMPLETRSIYSGKYRILNTF